MKIIVCIDNNNGMMFNNRRQSQDKNLRNDIKNLTSNNFLYMNKYSYDLYKDIDSGNIKVCADFLQKCPETDYCLVENEQLSQYINNINTIIIYKWNRDYPSDFKFDINISDKIWNLVNTTKFKGTSHDNITKEIYRRNINE